MSFNELQCSFNEFSMRMIQTAPATWPAKVSYYSMIICGSC